MSVNSISSPYPIFTDIDGDPLEAGYIYIGEPDKNPEASPVSVYWDQSLATPAAQPIRTIGGYPSNNGTPGVLYVSGDFSVTVKNKNSSLVYSAQRGTGILSSINSYATIDQLIGYTTAPENTSVNVLGYHSANDGGGGTFNWDSAADKSTANAGTIIDPSVSLANQGTGVGLGCWVRQYSGAGNVKWFGAVGDGASDDTIAIQNALNANLPLSDVEGTFKITNKLTSAGKDVVLDMQSAEFVFYNDDGGFELVGGWDDIQAVSVISGVNFTVEDSSVFEVGGLIKVVDEQPLAINPGRSFQGEFAVIYAISGNTLTLNSETYNSYSTSSTCRIGQIKDVNIKFNVGSVRYDNSVSSSTLELIYLEAVKGAEVDVNSIKRTLRGGVVMVSCFGCDINVNIIKNDLPSPSGNYGIVVTNSEQNTYKIASFYGGRTAFDGIGQQRGSDFSKYGSSAYNSATGSAFNTDEAAFVFHHGTHDNTFHDTVTRGCKTHGSMRGVNNIFTNPVSINDKSPFSAIRASHVEDGITDGTKVINPIVYGATETIVQIAGEGGDIDVIGGVIDCVHDAFTSMFSVGGSGNLRLINTRIVERGTVSLRAIRVDDTTVSGIELDKVTFDFRDGTLDGTFSLIDNGTTHSPNLIIKANDVTVLSNEPIHEFYDSPSLPAPGSYLSGLRFDDLTYLNSPFRVGFDQAVPAFQPFIKGQIVDGFKQIADANLAVAVTYDPPSIAPGATAISGGFTVNGAKTTDFVSIAPPYDLQGIIAYGYVNATDSLRIRLYNPTGTAIDLASGVWKIKVVQN